MHDHVIVDKSDSGAGAGMIVGILLALVLSSLLRRSRRFSAGQSSAPSNTNVNVPWPSKASLRRAVQASMFRSRSMSM